jgi:hypothetical protein
MFCKMLQSKFALPVELWSNITTEDEPEDEPEMRQTLLSVSHTFKSIVDNTAQLWTRLSFNCKDHFMQASSLLQKSHSLPLDIRISFFDLHLTTNDQVTLMSKSSQGCSTDSCIAFGCFK